MDKIIKEFLDFVKPESISREEQLENKISKELQILGYYPLDKETIELIKRFSVQLIKRLNAKKEK